MTYSIIPPILIILSLAGLILFLVKKSKKVVEITEPIETRLEKEKGIKKRFPNFFKKISFGSLKQSLLTFLEKMARFFRTTFLRLEVLFAKWIQSLRHKRNKNSVALEKEEPRVEQSVRKVQDFKIIQEEKTEEQKNPPSSIPRKSFELETEEEKEFKPIISEKVVKPRTQKEIKSRLEELLIERIASNPRDLVAYERLGEYYLEIESYEFAKECFKQILKLSPTNRNARYKIRRLENFLNR